MLLDVADYGVLIGAALVVAGVWREAICDLLMWFLPVRFTKGIVYGMDSQSTLASTLSILLGAVILFCSGIAIGRR